MKTPFVLLRDGYADWEPASAMAELRRSFGFVVKTLGLTSAPILSMGGLKVVPDLALAQFSPESADLLILPGGDSWMQAEVPEVTERVNAMLKASRPIAAICAATLALAHAGALDERQHTSNGRVFIKKHVPAHRGESLYRDEKAVSDRLVITANGLAPFAFAAAIFRVVAPQQIQDIETYERLYARGMLDDAP